MDLRQLSDQINSRIKTHNNDVQAHHLPNQREIQQLANISLSMLEVTFDEFKDVGHLRKLEKTKLVFAELLSFIVDDIKKNGRWSFWHYSGLCLITCFAYMELLKQGKHQTLNLSDEALWTETNYETAVLAINYIAGRLYPKALAELMTIGNDDKVNLTELCQIIRRRISEF